MKSSDIPTQYISSTYIILQHTLINYHIIPTPSPSGSHVFHYIRSDIQTLISQPRERRTSSICFALFTHLRDFLNARARARADLALLQDATTPMKLSTGPSSATIYIYLQLAAASPQEIMSVTLRGIPHALVVTIIIHQPKSGIRRKSGWLYSYIFLMGTSVYFCLYAFYATPRTHCHRLGIYTIIFPRAFNSKENNNIQPRILYDFVSHSASTYIIYISMKIARRTNMHLIMVQCVCVS